MVEQIHTFLILVLDRGEWSISCYGQVPSGYEVWWAC